MRDATEEIQARSRITARSARFSAQLFNYGCIAAILVPLPLGLLWLGASIVIYAMNRHHPIARVGHYTQRTAYVFYGVAGAFVAVATFFPGTAIMPYVATWALAAAIIIPWCILELIHIRRERWEDLILRESE